MILDHADDGPEAAADLPADGAVDDAVYYEEQVQPEYGILGLTLRELIIVGAWAVAFAVSFFPVLPGAGSIWTRGIGWMLTIGVPTVAVFLIVLRRFSPQGIRRVGSLGVDQFASVAASVAAVAWAGLIWEQVAATVDAGALLLGWVPIAATAAALVLVAATVAAPLIPRLRDDFEGRMETLAHRSANPVRPVIGRPHPEPVPEPAGEDSREFTVDPAVEDGQGGALTVVLADATPLADASRWAAPIDAAVEEANLAAGEPDSAVGEPDAAASDDDATRALDLGAIESASDGSLPSGQDIAYTDPIRALDDIFGAVEDAAATGDADAVSGARDAEDVLDEEPPLRRTRNEQERAAQQEDAPQAADAPFWVLASTERDVLDERGHPLFRIGPDAWTLVIEDRGGAYVVRHDDGRIGYLHDITDITKG